MPIASGARGRMSILVSPKGGWTPRGDGTGGPRGTVGSAPLGGWVPRSGRRSPARFLSPLLYSVGKSLSGVTLDSTGSPLGNCVVKLFDTRTDAKVAETTSDGSGNYSFGVAAGPYYTVEYKAGSPDVFGSSANTLTGI